MRREKRHFAAHPEDQDADVVIFKFYDDEEMSDESQVVPTSAGPTHKEP